LVAVLVAYPLSFGPTCWISSQTSNQRVWADSDWPADHLAEVPQAYWPMGWGAARIRFV
jgi:hypothetical protein